jgi:hypothetical protein
VTETGFTRFRRAAQTPFNLAYEVRPSIMTANPAGASFAGTSVFGVARLNTNGSLDSGFGNGGVLTTNFQGNDTARAVVFQPNGDIVVIGFSEDNTTGVVDIALARYLG